MVGDVGAEARAKVTGEANFDRHLTLCKLFYKVGIVEGGEAVADAFGSKVERSPDRFRRASFACVGGEAQAVVGRPSVGIAEEFGRRFLFVASDADADDLAIVIAD